MNSSTTYVMRARLAIFAAGMAAAVGSQAATLPKEIYFEGYCDGLTHVRTSPVGVVTGYWDLSQCPGDLGRYPVTMLRGGYQGDAGQTGTYDTSTRPDILQPGMVIRINDNGRFVYYDNEGNWASSGIWKAGPPHWPADAVCCDARRSDERTQH